MHPRIVHHDATLEASHSVKLSLLDLMAEDGSLPHLSEEKFNLREARRALNSCDFND